jgi:rhomboid protease GluP
MFGSAIFRQMILWAIIGLVLGFTRSGVDNLGHIGGLAAGALLALVLGFQEKKQAQLYHHLIALGTLAFIVVCFAMMMINFFRS